MSLKVLKFRPSFIILWMKLIMNDQQLTNLSDIQAFLTGNLDITFKFADKQEAYGWVESTLKRFRYHQQGKSDKGLLKRYIRKVTGYSRAQLTRLAKQYAESKRARFPKHRKNTFTANPDSYNKCITP